MVVESYSERHSEEWDRFVNQSSNGTFLSRRSFLGYHGNRFKDCSLMLRDIGGRLLAVFPATYEKGIVTTHAGVTFAGMLYKVYSSQASVLSMMEEIIIHYRRSLGATKLRYRLTPSIFRINQGEQDCYAVSFHGGVLIRRDVSTVVDLKRPIVMSKGRRSSIISAERKGISVREVSSLSQSYHLIQEAVSRHGRIPTHSLDELSYLKKLNPMNVRFFEGVREALPIAVCVVFDFGHLGHTQYMANSDEGRHLGALDLVVSKIIMNANHDWTHLSFGISSENDGKVLNGGLIAQKEHFGGVSLCCDHFEIDLA